MTSPVMQGLHVNRWKITNVFMHFCWTSWKLAPEVKASFSWSGYITIVIQTGWQVFNLLTCLAIIHQPIEAVGLQGWHGIPWKVSHTSTSPVQNVISSLPASIINKTKHSPSGHQIALSLAIAIWFYRILCCYI